MIRELCPSGKATDNNHTITNPVNVGATNVSWQLVPLCKSHELQPLKSETCGMWRHPVGRSKIIPWFRRESGPVYDEHSVYNLPHAPAGVANGIKLLDLLNAW